MNIQPLSRNGARIALATLFLLILGLQWPLLSVEPITNYDDHILINPLKSLGPDTISSYISKVKTGEVVDVQPVRDFSLWTDLQVESWIGRPVHHLHNVIIWFETLLFVYLLLRALGFSRWTSVGVTVLFGLHPCLWNSLCWISARKHLLSALSTVAATWLLIRCTNKRHFKITESLILIGLYFLACFAQPINIGWPLFALFYIWYHDNAQHYFLRQRETLFMGAGLGVVGILAAVANMLYYTGDYVAAQGATKFVSVEGSLGFQLLSFGRAYFQSLLPIKPTPTPYYPGSEWNYVGLVIAALLIFFLVRKKDKDLWAWFIFATLPIQTITVKMTHIFGYDTYLLMNCLGLYILTAKLIQDKKITFPLTAILAVFFVFQSSKVVWSFENGENVMKRAYEVEATPFNLKGLITQTNPATADQETLEKVIHLMNWNPYGEQVDLIYATFIYNSKKLDFQKKIDLLKSVVDKHPDLIWNRYYLGHLFIETQEFQQAYEIYRPAKKQDWPDLGANLSFVMAEYVFLCEVTEKTCSQVEDSMSYAKGSRYWNQAAYENRLGAMRKAVKKLDTSL